MTYDNDKRSIVKTCLPSGWRTALMAHILHVLLASGLGTIGIFMVEFVEHFNCSKAHVSLIGGILISLYSIGALVFGEFLSRFGPKITGSLGAILVAIGHVGASYSNTIPTLCLTLGVIAGFGYACMMLACNFSVQKYCTSWRSLASGIMTTGMSVGVLGFPPWTEFIIREYNWRSALLINAGIILHGLPLSMMLVPTEPVALNLKQIPHTQNNENNEMKTKESSIGEDTDMYAHEIHEGSQCGQEQLDSLENSEFENHMPSQTSVCKHNRFKLIILTYIQLIKTPRTLLFILSTALIQSGHLGPYSYMPMRAVQLGFTKDKAALWLSIAGVVGAVGRLVSGFIGNYFSHRRIIIYGMCGIVTGGANVISVLIYSYFGLVAYGAIFALISGGYMTFATVIMTDLVGIKRLPQIMAVTFPLIGTLQLIVTSTSGILIDATGSAAVPFMYFGSIQIFGGVISLIILRLVARQHGESQQREIKQSFDNCQ